MTEKLEFLYLGEEDMLRAGVENMSDCINTMEDVFSLMAKNDYRMGGPSCNDHGIMMKFPKESDLADMPLDGPDKRVVAMPAYLGGKYHMCGIKTYASDQHNRAIGLPRSILMLTLMDPQTGVPVAYLSANVLSAMRTGAVPGLGVRYLVGRAVHTVTIIGPGVMGKTALQAFISERPEIDTVRVKGRSEKGVRDFIAYCTHNFPTIKRYVACDTVQDACVDSDVICVGTTNAPVFEDNPYIDGRWLKRGALVISTSSLRMDEDFLADKSQCRLITDNYKMYAGWGAGHPYPTQKSVSTLIGMRFYDLVTSGKLTRSDIAEIGDIINGDAVGRQNEEQILVYSVGGMPTEDVAWGCKCLSAAKAQGLGQKLLLWNKPALA